MGTFYEDDTGTVSPLFEEDPDLFRAVNLLKASSIIYKKYNPAEYDLLSQRRPDVNRILSYDGCRLEMNSEFGTASIRFIRTDDSVGNALRAVFSANDMKVYVSLLHLYEEKYSAQGAFVRTDYIELQGLMQDLEFKLDSTGKVSRSRIKEHIMHFKSMGLVTPVSDKEFMINPGILTCISREEFDPVYEEKVRPWLLRDGDEEETEKTPEEDTLEESE